MANLRIRVELNKGRIGIPMRKFSEITKETVKFLSMVCADVGVHKSTDEWLALNFENNSVDFDCHIGAEIDEEKARLGRHAFKSIMSDELPGQDVQVMIRPATRLQYSHIASLIDPDEVIRFGVYRNGESKPEDWYNLDKRFANKIAFDIPSTASYYGEIQGIVHAFYKESDRPKLVVRELSTRGLVDCFFKRDMYQNAIDVLREKDGVVFVEGTVTENIATGVVESIEVSDFTPAPLFDKEEYDKFLGTHPNLTGKLSSEEYIERFRNNDATA